MMFSGTALDCDFSVAYHGLASPTKCGSKVSVRVAVAVASFGSDSTEYLFDLFDFVYFLI